MIPLGEHTDSYGYKITTFKMHNHKLFFRCFRMCSQFVMVWYCLCITVLANAYYIITLYARVAHQHMIWGLCCQKQVSQAGISNCIPQDNVGCNFLSLTELLASGANAIMCNRHNGSEVTPVNLRKLGWHHKPQPNPDYVNNFRD